ncbi:helix-turn-helix domain-containing protein [Streptomyces sp. NPDC056402]|uniref:helix-turn-helix domain-containing protein n=1 Tax=Streptomyces sp. NPDC056402 TaxID=3345810 RepID=UPI0035E25B60
MRALRRRIVLACADGASNEDVAAQLGAPPQTVGRRRARFVPYRIESASSESRQGA